MTANAFSPANKTARYTVVAGGGTAMQAVNDPTIVAGSTSVYRILNASTGITWVAYGPTLTSVQTPVIPSGNTIAAANGFMLAANAAIDVLLPSNSWFNTVGAATGDLYITAGG